MKTRFKRKLAAFLAVVMFITSLPVSAWAEADPEIIQETMQTQTSDLGKEPVGEQPVELESAAKPSVDVVGAQPVNAVLQDSAVLENPVVSMPSSVNAGQEVVITWEPVENAEEYVVMLYQGDGTYICDIYYGAETSATITRQLETGTYSVTVLSRAEGWENGGSNVSFEVVGELSAPPVLSLDAENYVIGSKITYSVTAEGADRIRIRYHGTSDSGHEHQNEFEFDSNGTTTKYEEESYIAGTFQAECSVRVDGAWSAWCAPVPFEVKYLGELSSPVLTMKDSFVAGEPIEVSWTPVDNTEGYVIFITDSNGTNINSWWAKVGETSLTLDTVLEAGSYDLSVRVSADAWKSPEPVKHAFAVTGTLAEGPAFTVDKNTVVTGNKVTFTVFKEGAARFRMRYGWNTEEYEAENGTAVISQTFYGDDEEVTVQFSACVDGVWTAYGPTQTITVTGLPTLGSTFAKLPQTIRAGEDIALTWDPVEHAENYQVIVSKDTGNGYTQQVWSDYLNAATEDCSTVIPAGELKQGQHYVSISASASGYKSPASTSVIMEVGAPLPGNEFDCNISSDGTQAYLYGYLGDPNAEEVVIPETIKGATVVGIYGSNFLKNNGTLKKVTIPASVGYIADDAFLGSTDLTVYGYSGSDAEEFAVFNGHTFVPLDSGESAVSATWPESLQVNAESTVFISAPGATSILMRVDGSSDVDSQLSYTQSGATVVWTPRKAGNQIVQFQALIDGEYISSRYYVVNVTSMGQMPQVEALTPSATTIEPGTAVTIGWTNPANVTAPQYEVAITGPDDSWVAYWRDVTAGKTTYTWSAYYFEDEGNYTLMVRLLGTPGYEASVTNCTVEVKSTQLWDYNPSNQTLLAYNGTDTEIVIPSEINGQPVRNLGSQLFANSSITSVTIPAGVETVGWQAFYGCDKLTRVELPSTLKEISNAAFSQCTKLAQIQLPAGLTTLDTYAFSDCDALTSVVIPEGIKELENGVFSSCDALSQVTLPEGLSTIGSGAFSYCKQLQTITIPQNVSSINEYAFQGITDLTIQGYSGSVAETFAEAQGYTFVSLGAAETGDITFTLKSDKVYQSGYLKVTITAPKAEKLRLHLDNSITEYSISNGKAELSLFAIYSLGEHRITVSQCIGGKWMAPCAEQTFTVIEMPQPVIEPIDPVPASTPVTIRWKPVDGADSYTLYVSKDTVHIADFQNVQNIDKDGFVYQQLEADFLTHEGYYDVQVTAHMTDGGNSYGKLSFQVTAAQVFQYAVNDDGTATLTGCTSAEQIVTVPDQLDGHAVVTIAQKAFLNSKAITVELPASVKLVEQWAFYGCPYLETVKLLEAQATVSRYAFEDCTKLVSIYLGKGVFVNNSAFAECRTDTVIYGYSGGNVEEVAKAERSFSSLGMLAAGPAIEAENIWQNEELDYTVSHESASQLYIQEVYPDGTVEAGFRFVTQTQETADSQSFEDLTEDSEVIIKAAALVNGEWTAYATKQVAVSVLKKLTVPLFQKIEPLYRHLDQVIEWYPVENAEQYRVIISSGMHIVDLDETVNTAELALGAGALPEGSYTIRVTAMAEGYEDATGSAEFDVISLKLDKPVITVDQRIPRHLGATISWEPVEFAQNYSVLVQAEGVNGPISLFRNAALEDTQVTLTPAQLKVGDCTVTVTANAQYCTSSDEAKAEFEIYEEQLDAPEITAPTDVVGGVSFDVTWKTVENAEKYHLEIMDEEGYRLFYQTFDSQTRSHTVTLDTYLQERNLTLRVIASADYRVDGVAEQAMAYKPLYTCEIVDGNAVITGYNGSDTELNIPGWIEGYKVIAIGEGAFENNDSITAVYLHENVEIIGDRSFKNCTALRSITGDGVKEIGEEAFYNCVSLTNISFGRYESEVKTKPNAFYNTPITDPSQDTDVDGLLDIIIANPSEVKDHSNRLFVGTVTYEEGIVEIPAHTHYNNVLLRKVVLPKSLKTIGSEAFAECPALTEVWLYDGVESIAEDAFSNSDNLCLYIRTENMDQVSYVEQYAIDHNIPYVKKYINPMISAIYPEGTYGVAEQDHYANAFLQHVYLPESLQFIQSKAFAQCENLVGVQMYDGITSIAEDAFEGSGNVQFIIYVTDLESVSYVEQYAMDHNIPYTKLPKDAPVSDNIDIGGAAGIVTVRIDTPIQITVTDIPADADQVRVYLDGELIYDGAVEQTTSVDFTYTFQEFGPKLLTAEALRDGEVIKYSWEKTAIVAGIRLTADKETAWTCESVTFTVEAYPETGTVQFLAEDLLFGTLSLTDGAGELEHKFTQAGDREITVRSEDGTYSRTMILPIQCIAQLEQPVLEAEELQYTGNGLVCSWNTTANTDGYVLRVRYANGADLIQRDIVDDGSDRMSCTISAEDLGGAGTFELYLMNYGYKYDQNESEVIGVELTADLTPVFTMDKQTVMTGDPVTFTIRAFEATTVELLADGEVIESISLTNGRGVCTRAFSKSGSRKMTIRALRADGWTEPSEVQILTVQSLGALNAVIVTARPIQLLGNAVTASWTAVDHAEGYTVYFRNSAHETIYQQTTTDCSISVPAGQIQQIGEYYFLVMAYGAKYDQSEGSANVTVVDKLPAPEIVTPAENAVCNNTAATLTWQAVSGAESYVVSLARKTDRVDTNGQPVYEKVWAAPNETINVGTDLSYDLTGLIYGGEYRVAVGAVASMDDGTESISWSERLFSVQMPELSVTLTADAVTATAGSEVTLTAVANHPMTAAVLTDETGAVVKTVSSENEETNGTRVFTFVITETEWKEKTYTVTVSGIDQLAEVKSTAASVQIKWVDPDAAVIESVTSVPASIVVNKMVTFSITTNANTTSVEVYRQKTDDDPEDDVPAATLKPMSSENGKVIFYYLVRFDELGKIDLSFIPLNGEKEKGEAFTKTVVVLPEGMLPAPKITAPESNATVSNWGYTVKWDPVVLDPGVTIAGYSVTVYEAVSNGSSVSWNAIPGQTEVFVGTACSYDIPAMDAGKWYRIKVYTVPTGMDKPAANVSGCSYVDFRMEGPDVSIVTPENNASVLVGNTIPVEGTAGGGITKVRIQLVTGSYSRILQVKDAEGNPVDYLLVDVVDGKFSAVLDPVNTLIPSAGTETNHAVEVYGFLDGYTCEITNKADSDWRMLNVDDATIRSIQSNKVAPNNWVMIGENVHIEVTTNKLVKDIRLFDGDTALNLTIHKDEEISAEDNYFWADFTAVGEGLHVIKAADANGRAVPKSVNVYVVTPTTPETEVHLKSDITSTTGWVIPQENYNSDKNITITEKTKLIQRGVCGDFVLVRVNDGNSYFVHKDKLDKTYQILNPVSGLIINLQENREILVEWSTYPQASRYKTIMTVTYIDRYGKTAQETFTKDVISVAGTDVQNTIYTADEILTAISAKRSFKCTTWNFSIQVIAY